MTACSHEPVVLVPYEESNGEELAASPAEESLQISSEDASRVTFGGIQAFRYDSLEDKQKGIYILLYDGIISGEERISVGKASFDEINQSLHALLADHPEIYWLDGSANIYTTPIIGTSSVELNVCADANERALADAAIQRGLEAYYATLPLNASPYETVKAAYSYVIFSTQYDSDAPNSQDIRSVFMEGRSVCAGYARAFQYLMHRSGIACGLMEGETTNLSTGNREKHAWNIVDISGEETYVDVTWGDPNLQKISEDAPKPSIYYGYLCMTKEDILRLGHESGEGLPMPECTGRTYDWYVVQGRYFQTFQEEDARRVFEEALNGGVREVHFRYASFDEYARACARIFDEGLFSEYLQRIMQEQGLDNIHYLPVRSDSLKSIDLYW